LAVLYLYGTSLAAARLGAIGSQIRLESINIPVVTIATAVVALDHRTTP